MTYRYFFFDLDNTLLNFDAAEDQALSNLFKAHQLPLTPTIKQAYRGFNQGLWRRYELGDLSRPKLMETRFATFIKQQFNQTLDGQQLADEYLGYLANGHELMPQAEPLLTQLSQQAAQLFVATNGVVATQYRRIADAQLNHFFKQIFVSEEIGYQKPNPLFFTNVFDAIQAFKPEEAVIVGDSLTSDIQGGYNAGIDTVWYNPKQLSEHPPVKPTHEIHNLLDLLAL